MRVEPASPGYDTLTPVYDIGHVANRSTRWSTTLLSEVQLHHALKFTALCSANLAHLADQHVKLEIIREPKTHLGLLQGRILEIFHRDPKHRRAFLRIVFAEMRGIRLRWENPKPQDPQAFHAGLHLRAQTRGRQHRRSIGAFLSR